MTHSLGGLPFFFSPPKKNQNPLAAFSLSYFFFTASDFFILPPPPKTATPPTQKKPRWMYAQKKKKRGGFREEREKKQPFQSELWTHKTRRKLFAGGGKKWGLVGWSLFLRWLTLLWKRSGIFFSFFSGPRKCLCFHTTGIVGLKDFSLTLGGEKYIFGWFFFCPQTSFWKVWPH